MVHGGCQSIGCFAMTNDVVDEIWRLVTAALDAGQPAFNVQVFPFRMTEKNLAARKADKWSGFWADLKKGYDSFERTKLPPVVSVCDGRYLVSERTSDAASSPQTAACPATASRGEF
jgi:murein L,D-transpeptidase YafK